MTDEAARGTLVPSGGQAMGGRMIRSGLCPINARAGGGTTRDVTRERTDATRGSVNKAAETDTQHGGVLAPSPAEFSDGGIADAVLGCRAGRMIE
jgi:hypothetical protein